MANSSSLQIDPTVTKSFWTDLLFIICNSFFCLVQSPNSQMFPSQSHLNLCLVLHYICNLRSKLLENRHVIFVTQYQSYPPWQESQASSLCPSHCPREVRLAWSWGCTRWPSVWPGAVPPTQGRGPDTRRGQAGWPAGPQSSLCLVSCSERQHGQSWGD